MAGWQARWVSATAALGLVLLAQLAAGQAVLNSQGQLTYTLGNWLTANDAKTLEAWGWNDGGNPCSGWVGVTCNSEGFVSSIDLAGKSLTGSLPPDASFWSGLTGLTSINLADNSLSGTVPQGISAAVVIRNVPLCSCALKGFGSNDCAAAVAGKCAGPSPPAFCKAGDVSKDAQAATAFGSFLGKECFPDPLCLPFQNIIDSNGSSSAAAVGAVAPVLDAKCPVAEPTQPGVKATMEFPNLSMGEYITRQYSQNVANALSSVTALPSTAISAIDVRPFTSSSAAGRRRSRALLADASSSERLSGSLRVMLQESGNGVQATYFLATDDPTAVSQKLSAAAGDGSLSTKLSQYGISSQAGGLKVQSFLPPPPPPADSGSSSSGFPLWALAPIIGGVLGLLLLVLVLWCCCCRKDRKSKQGKEKKLVPAPVKSGTVGAAVGSAAVTASVPKNDSNPDRDTLPKTYDYRPAPIDPDYGSSKYGDRDTVGFKSSGSGISPAAAAAAGVGVGAAAAGGAAALTKSTSQRTATPEDLPLSRSMRVDSPDHFAAGPTMQREGSGAALGASNSGTLTPWEAGVPRSGRGSPAPPAAASPAHLTHLSSLAPVRTSVGGPASPGLLGAAGAGALAGAGASGSSSGLPQHDSGAWRSNVRPTSSGSMSGSAAGGASSMAGAKSMQQAERAKFWAQFQETWQQVAQDTGSSCGLLHVFPLLLASVRRVFLAC
eukprot:gene7238-7451_t